MSHPFNLSGKRILVTGASSGIGKSIAIECSKMGAELVLLGRNEERLIETLSLLDNASNHSYYAFDFEDGNDFVEIVGKILEGGKLHGLVNSAGIIDRKPLKFIKKEQFEKLLDINLLSAFELIQTFMKLKGILNEGSIVFISSVAKDYAALGNIMYMASKGAVNSMSRGLALELARNQIRVNTIEPGLIVSNLTNGISENELNENIQLYPLGRFGKPEEVAYASIYLLSDATSWMTGSCIRIDGGLTLR